MRNVFFFTTIVDVLTFCIRFMKNCIERPGKMNTSPFGGVNFIRCQQTRQDIQVICLILIFSSYISHMKLAVLNQTDQSVIKYLFSHSAPLSIVTVFSGCKVDCEINLSNVIHPTILPTQNKLSVLIVNYFYDMHFHAGLN